jgi:hypothetical protein
VDAKTRPVFDGYKAAQYNKKYLVEHEAEPATCLAVKAAINDILNGASSPAIQSITRYPFKFSGK